MSETFGYDAGMDPRSEESSGVRMAQVVEAHGIVQTKRLPGRTPHLSELRGVERAAVPILEDVIVARRRPARRLHLVVVLSKDGQNFGRYIDPTSALGLRLTVLPRHFAQLSANHDVIGSHVLPAQPEQFGFAYTGRNGNHVCCAHRLFAETHYERSDVIERHGKRRAFFEFRLGAAWKRMLDRIDVTHVISECSLSDREHVRTLPVTVHGVEQSKDVGAPDARCAHFPQLRRDNVVCDPCVISERPCNGPAVLRLFLVAL